MRRVAARRLGAGCETADIASDSRAKERPIAETLATRLRSFRSARGLTQTQLAELVGVSPITIVRWENDSSKPNRLAADRLQTLGVGPIERHETKAVSSPRSVQVASAAELRAGVRSRLVVDGTETEFTPAPYVLNGPEDQLGFYERLYDLQAQPLAKGLLDPRSLTLVAEIPELSVVPSQLALERPKAAATAWTGTYGTHGFHRYVGRFPPHLVRALLNHFALPRGAAVCDPFVGSGTTVVEARLLGLRGTGIDVCPLSTMMTRAKAQFPSSTAVLEELVLRLREFYEPRFALFDRPRLTHDAVLRRPGNTVPHFTNVERWFTPRALLGVSIVTEFVQTLDGYERDLVATCLSAQMRSIGNVDVDVVRAEYRKTPRQNVDVLRLVTRKLSAALGAIDASLRTHTSSIGEAGDIAVEQCSLLDADIPAQSLDAIVTSPPYGVESLSYLRTHLLSYRALKPVLDREVYEWDRKIIGSEFLGPEVPVVDHKAAVSATYTRFFRESEPSSADRRAGMMMQFFDDMTDTVERLARWLRPGGRLAFVIGNKSLGGRIVPTDQIMRELFEAGGLRVDDVVSHKLKTNNSNSEVPWQERVIQQEHVLVCTRVGHAPA